MAKRCSRCNQWRDSSEFYKDKSKRDGLKSHCKACHEVYKRGYRSTPAAKQVKERRETARRKPTAAAPPPPPDDLDGLFQAWRRHNTARRKAFVRAQLRKWHAQHPSESRGWARQNRESIRTSAQGQRAARLHAAINTFSVAEWQWLIERFESRCAYCGKICTGLTPDHVLPLSRGGNNSLGNIVPACGPCNLRKGARTPDEAGLSFAVQVNPLRSLQQLSLI